jgi:hypothetical protein
MMDSRLHPHLIQVTNYDGCLVFITSHKILLSEARERKDMHKNPYWT